MNEFVADHCQDPVAVERMPVDDRPSEPLDHQLLRLASDRRALDDHERRLIAEAREYGWNNGDIGKVLGITRQAVGQKLRRERTRRPGAVALVEQAQQQAEQRAVAHKLMRQLLQR
jgi:IS30 family transposase